MATGGDGVYAASTSAVYTLKGDEAFVVGTVDSGIKALAASGAQLYVLDGLDRVLSASRAKETFMRFSENEGLPGLDVPAMSYMQDVAPDQAVGLSDGQLYLISAEEDGGLSCVDALSCGGVSAGIDAFIALGHDAYAASGGHVFKYQAMA